MFDRSQHQDSADRVSFRRTGHTYEYVGQNMRPEKTNDQNT